MIRDFSEKAKQKLEGYADDAAASSTWGKIKDWFSDRGMDFRSWAGKLGAGDTSCKKSSDPVNLSTGNFIYDHEDMQAGGEIPLSFHRYYNSKDTGTGTMGSCFLHNYEMEVQKQPDQKAAVRMRDGQFYYFAETDTGYVAENAAMGLLERTEDGYKLTCHPGMDAVYFDENGKAARQENTNKGESHLSVMKEEGWQRRKPIQETPCTLNGFTGARNGQIIPEWSLSGEYVKPKKGAELHKVVNGKDTVVAIFDGKHFVEVKGK